MPFDPEQFANYKPYRKFKQDHPDAIVLILQEGYFATYGDDAEILIEVCGLGRKQWAHGLYTTFWYTFLDQDLKQLAEAGHTKIVLVHKDGKKFNVISRREFDLRFGKATPETAEERAAAKKRRPRRVRLPREIDYFKEFKALKKFYPEAILLVRTGMGYETFCQDAQIVSEVCRERLHMPDSGGMTEFTAKHLERHRQKLLDAGHQIVFAEMVRDKFQICDPQPFSPKSAAAPEDRAQPRSHSKPEPNLVQRQLSFE